MRRKSTLEARIIKEIVARSAGSRMDLCRNLHLSKASITIAVTKLIKSGLIEEEPGTNKGRGRKAKLLKVRPDLAYFLGADLEGKTIRSCIIDCDRKVISSHKHIIKSQLSGKNISRLIKLVDNMVKNSGINREKIAGLGLSLPGTVCKGSFKTRAYLPPGRIIELDFGQIQNLGYDCVMDNNVRCVSEYEKRLGAAVKLDEFFSVLIRYGLGVAIYTNGSFVSSHGMAIGELGHIRINIDGPECVCGQKGCLDVYLSGRVWQKHNFKTAEHLKKDLVSRARYLGIGLANLIKLVRLPAVIINGIYNEYEHIMKPPLLGTLEKELSPIRYPVPNIVLGDHTELKPSIGAALMAADSFLEEYADNHVFQKQLV